MKRICFFHAGCPDGFGAAWAVRRFWGDDAEYRPRSHDDAFTRADLDAVDGARIAFVDIAPRPRDVLALAEVAAELVVLDHHVSSRDRFEADLSLRNAVEAHGHTILFDLDHSGAALAWMHFADGEPLPELLGYVEDQDLWAWKLPRSEEVNAAIDSYPLRFDVWDELARRDPFELAREGEPLVRAKRTEVARAVRATTTLVIEGRRVEAVNASVHRSAIGHELAKRAAFGEPWGCVYRVNGDRVTATLYSIGDVDV
ncbi:MAG: hypothetical protein KC560_09750, partial [Myxococcales bacterium]|nr:hypothetical protein [Myxococcales bacterium]